MKKKKTGREIVAALKRTGYIKEMFNTPEKLKLIEPLFLIVLPVILQVVEELGPEDAFEYIYSDSFKTLLQATVEQQASRYEAKTEVNNLFNDLGIVSGDTNNEQDKPSN